MGGVGEPRCCSQLPWGCVPGDSPFLSVVSDKLTFILPTTTQQPGWHSPSGPPGPRSEGQARYAFLVQKLSSQVLPAPPCWQRPHRSPLRSLSFKFTPCHQTRELVRATRAGIRSQPFPGSHVLWSWEHSRCERRLFPPPLKDEWRSRDRTSAHQRLAPRVEASGRVCRCLLCGLLVSLLST